jgi:ATP-dependent Lhr-like helicase
LSRDELVECAALLHCVHRGELDRLIIPEKPLDVLAQQIVAAAAAEDWDENEFFNLARSSWPYRNLTREEFDSVVKMLAEGFSTKRGRRSALIHHDGVNHRLRGRRGARLVALTSGGAIPDNADYRVILDPSETFVGTVNEDFAVESLAGDIFQLGNASWRILRINSGVVRVEDAKGQPPGIPFWLGEAPARTSELSNAVSDFRIEIETRLADGQNPTQWLGQEMLLPADAAEQLGDYFAGAYRSLGTIPSQQTLVMERFFDESGGMQLVLHSPFGNRINRAWGLALRKRFCRSFNFELQAAATGRRDSNFARHPAFVSARRSFSLSEFENGSRPARFRHCSTRRCSPFAGAGTHAFTCGASFSWRRKNRRARAAHGVGKSFGGSFPGSACVSGTHRG